MDMHKGSTPAQLKLRRIGKKVIFYHRVAPALGAVSKPKEKRSWISAVKSFRPTKKQLIITAAAVVVIGIIAAVGIIVDQKKQADEKAAAATEAARIERVNAAAQVCYQKKMKEKAAMLDKITYDQLYDGDSCLTQ
jgi:hypothetical protein